MKKKIWILYEKYLRIKKCKKYLILGYGKSSTGKYIVYLLTCLNYSRRDGEGEYTAKEILLTPCFVFFCLFCFQQQFYVWINLGILIYRSVYNFNIQIFIANLKNLIQTQLISHSY